MVRQRFLPLSVPGFAKKQLPRDLTELVSVATACQALPRSCHSRTDTHTATPPKASRKKDELDFELGTAMHWQSGAMEQALPQSLRSPGGRMASRRQVPQSSARGRTQQGLDPCGVLFLFEVRTFPCPAAPFRHRHVSYVSLSTGFHRAVRAGEPSYKNPQKPGLSSTLIFLCINTLFDQTTVFQSFFDLSFSCCL
ncbi:hypothetical protein BJX65DRAFT_123027 [Aspergillus insuetus]